MVVVNARYGGDLRILSIRVGHYSTEDQHGIWIGHRLGTV